MTSLFLNQEQQTVSSSNPTKVNSVFHRIEIDELSLPVVSTGIKIKKKFMTVKRDYFFLLPWSKKIIKVRRHIILCCGHHCNHFSKNHFLTCFTHLFVSKIFFCFFFSFFNICDYMCVCVFMLVHAFLLLFCRVFRMCK